MTSWKQKSKGLTIRSNHDDQAYDTFKNRITFSKNLTRTLALEDKDGLVATCRADEVGGHALTSTWKVVSNG